MAKYKFTKTIRPAEGICIDADGTVTELPVPSVPVSKKIILPAIPVMTSAAATAYSTKHGGMRKREKRWRSKRFAPIGLATPVPVPGTHRKPLLTIPLTSVANPYYGETAIRNVPPTKPCGVFGISMPKPITRTAALSFQKRG